jgi:hypothetical protein
MRVHSISSTNPEAPDRKKQPRITARMAPDSTPATWCADPAVFDNLRLSDYH